MSNLLQVKTNFTAGCIGRNLYGRGDLSIFENRADLSDLYLCR